MRLFTEMKPDSGMASSGTLSERHCFSHLHQSASHTKHPSEIRIKIEVFADLHLK